MKQNNYLSRGLYKALARAPRPYWLAIEATSLEQTGSGFISKLNTNLLDLVLCAYVQGVQKFHEIVIWYLSRL